MPGPFFTQVGGKWKFYCKVDWDVVETIPEYVSVVEGMKQKWGIHKKAWPDPCCGAKFVPWARGASKVIELRMQDGNWACILAERMPQQLDDEIKQVLFAWHEAESRLTAAEIMKALPKTMPMINKTTCDGVSRFPLKEWKAMGSPTLTCGGWIALCRLVASKDKLNLQHIITLCDNHEEKLQGDIDDWMIVVSKPS